MNSVPQHVAIICDGNRRWARERGLPTLIGHKKGFEALNTIARFLRKKGVHTLTVWIFSTENWDRSPEEVSYLMKLAGKVFDENLEEIIKDKVKVVHMGRKDRLPKDLLKKIEDAENKTKDFDTHILNVALDYGGHDEIVRAINRYNKSDKKDEVVTAENFSQFLDTKDQPYPNPDIVIRTGGEMRFSGFLSWQIEYAELFFLKKALPELTTQDIDKVFEEFFTRQRRFGK